MIKKIFILFCSYLIGANTLPAQTVNVWPGDVNNDLIVNNKDLLFIGITYGATGPLRSAASGNWVAQPVNQWTETFYNGENIAGADCNGDGVISADDTTYILQNYNLTHSKKNNQQPITNNPQLYFDFPKDSVQVGDTVYVPIYLGTANLPVDSIYGIAFTINYDPSLVDSASVTVRFDNSWLGTINNEIIDLRKDFYLNGAMDAAVTRISLTNKSGYGQIGTVSFVMHDDLSGKDLKTKKMYVSASNVYALTIWEKEVYFDTPSDSVVVWQDTTTITTSIHKNSVTNLLHVFPNPATDILHVIWGAVHSSALAQIKIKNLLGETVYTTSTPNNVLDIDVRFLPKGIYTVFIQTEEKQYTKHLVTQ